MKRVFHFKKGKIFDEQDISDAIYSSIAKETEAGEYPTSKDNFKITILIEKENKK